MKRFVLLLAVATSVGAQLPQQTPQSTKAEFTVKKDVVYGKGTHGDLLANIYLPQKKQEKMPAVLLIRGGAWEHGTRDDMSPASDDMAAAGFVGMTIDYDLSGASGVHFPVALDQCWMALHWLRRTRRSMGSIPRGSRLREARRAVNCGAAWLRRQQAGC